MAKAPPAKPAAPAAESATPPKKSKKLLVIIIALVVLLIAGGAGAFLMLKGSGGGDAKAERKTTKADHSAPPVFMSLEPFTTNLARDEGDHYVQVVVVLRLADAKVEQEVKSLMPEVRHRVNLLLSSKLPSQLATMEGRQVLSEEIQAEANDVLGYEPPKRSSRRKGEAEDDDAPVIAVLFNSIIIQ